MYFYRDYHTKIVSIGLWFYIQHYNRNLFYSTIGTKTHLNILLIHFEYVIAFVTITTFISICKLQHRKQLENRPELTSQHKTNTFQTWVTSYTTLTTLINDTNQDYLLPGQSAILGHITCKEKKKILNRILHPFMEVIYSLILSNPLAIFSCDYGYQMPHPICVPLITLCKTELMKCEVTRWD